MSIGALQTPSPLERTDRFRWLQYAPVIAGILLCAAALLKAYQIANNPIGGAGFGPLTSRWLAIIEVECEAILGGMILLRLFQAVTKWLAISVFTCFAAFSVYRGMMGDASCNCFGNMAVNPWVTASLDVVLVVVLSVSSNSSKVSVGHLRWTISVAIAMICIFGALAMAGVGSFAMVASRGVVVDARRYDFGEIMPVDADHLNHVFRITNYDDQPVRILGSKSTCHCTVPKISQSMIDPGQSIEIPVFVNWGLRAGKQHEEIILETDSPKQPRLILAVSGAIISQVTYWPNAVDFGDVREGQQLERTITIFSGPHTNNFRITSVRSKDLALIVTPQNVDVTKEDKPSHAYDLTLARSATPGYHSSVVTFDLNMVEQRSIQIPVSFHVMPSIGIEPSAALFTFETDEATKSFHISSPDRVMHTLLSINSLQEGTYSLSVGVPTWHDGSWDSVLTVRIARQHFDGMLSGSIIVSTQSGVDASIPIVLVQ